MKISQIFFVLCALTCISCKPRLRECNFGWEVYNCMTKIQFDVNRSFLHFMNEEQLDEACRKFMPAVECMVELAKWCNQNPRALMESVFDHHRTMKNLCQKDGDFRQDYLKLGACLNGNKDGYDLACYDGGVMPPEHVDPNEEDCELYRNVTENCGESIFNTCGQDAVVMVVQLQMPMLNYYKKMCKDT